MINELYSVYQGLRDVGEEPVIKHNDICSPGENNTTFRVCLDENGNVASVGLLTKEMIRDTWSLGNGNKNQFPAAKFEYPLMPEGHKEYQKWKTNNNNPDAPTYRNMLLEMFEQYSVSISDIVRWPTYRSKIIERKELLEKYLLSIDKGVEIYELFNRYSKSEEDGIAILKQVVEKLKCLIPVADKDFLKAISNFLLGDVLDTKGRLKDTNRVTLLIDCLPQKDIDIYASSRNRVSVLSEALFAIDKKNGETIKTCSVTGDYTEVFQDVFPSEKLSVVGKTILLAKSDATSGSTVKRYGKAGTDSYLLSKRIGEKLAAAISFLTSDNLENKTWQKIPSSTGSSPSLLLAYCKNDFDLAITPAITGGDIEDFDDYENATKTVIELFKKSNLTPDNVVEICEIRVLDKANRKVNYSVVSSIGNVHNAANNWITACKNVPNFKLLVKIKKESKLLHPWVIAPIETVNLTKNKYIRGGGFSTPVSSLSFADTMTLFMSKSDSVKQLALRTIEKLSDQVEPLFEYCALSKNQGLLNKKVQRVKTDTNKNSTVLKTVTLFGILLFKAGRKKEVFMSSFAYQLGQLCSAMDELHIGYCQSMRKGDIPNTLIGNTTYNVALQNSIKSLALLASRIKPYEAWADREIVKHSTLNDVSDKVIKNALFARLWMKNHSSVIAKHFSEKSSLINDTYKAELMLGYLAGRPFNERNSNSNNEGAEQ